MAGIKVKEEYIEQQLNNTRKSDNIPVIDLESSDDDDNGNDDDDDDEYSSSNGKRFRVSNNNKNNNENNKKLKKNVSGVVLPEGFLDPLPPRVSSALRNNANESRKETAKGGNNERVKRSNNVVSCNKQFWKAGDFEENSFSSATATGSDWNITSGGMDHLRVHPRFLHSNATSHKWVLGAFAELLDNSLDEVCNGATYVKIDMLINKKDDSRMLLIEDNGGGMDPEKMRHCMSLGYSLKSKVKDTIGQYGNGFKTSTMRLGADVIVFSRSSGKDGKRSTQSIGMLSYTFLRSTGKEDIVVPMLDYERREQEWKNMNRVSTGDWDRNVEALVQWSPFSSEADLLRQFDNMKAQGTRIIIYNLWEDDQGQLELDFDTDKQDIQIRGVNRDEQNIKMAQEYPNSRHFLTYRHSLRIYASILYLRVPHNFRMILRGKDIVHHNIINDMMMTNEVTYRPQPGQDGILKDTNMVAVVTVGFVKDAKAHIDVQGFNVYHKNRLIKPFWRIWNAAGSDGRGVIGVLEANFVEPAHDKQGFERTNVLQRLETRLIQMQKTYWGNYCHKIGYAPRGRNMKDYEDRETSPDYTSEVPPRRSSAASDKAPPVKHSDKFSHINQKGGTNPTRHPSDTVNNNINIGDKSHRISGTGIGASSSESTSPLIDNNGDDDLQTPMTTRYANDSAQVGGLSAHTTHSVSAREAKHPEPGRNFSSSGKAMQVVAPPHLRSAGVNGNVTVPSNYSNPEFLQLVEENRALKERLRRREEEILGDLLHDLESERCRRKELEAQLESEKQKFEVLNKEQDSIIAIFSEERERRDTDEEVLRKKLKEAEVTTKTLMEKVTQLQLEKMKTMGRKWGQ